MSDIKFSVIIPAYNAAAFIGDAVASVHAQGYENWEIIVVNDASKDDTAAVVEAMAAKDGRIVLLNNAQGLGAAGSRNRALGVASGDYLLFLDADDFYVCPKLFGLLAEYIDRYDVDILNFGFNTSGSRDMQPVPLPAEVRCTEVDYEAAVRRVVSMVPAEAVDRSMWLGSASCKAYRASLIRDNGIQFPMNVKNAEDVRFNLRVLALHPSMRRLNVVGMHYWNNVGNSCNRYMPEFRKDFPWMVQDFERECEVFRDVPGVIARLNVRLMQFVDKVLRQYYCHPSYVADGEESCRDFLRREDVRRIVRGVDASSLALQPRLLVYAARLRSALLCRGVLRSLPKFKRIVKR